MNFSKDSITWEDISDSSDSNKVLGEKAIQKVINNILSIKPRERLFKPKFGCNLDNLLFELIDEETANLIRLELYNCIENNDPRLRVLPNATIVTPYPDDYRYDIELAVEVLGIGNANFKFSLNAFE